MKKSSVSTSIERVLALANLVPLGDPNEVRLWSYAAELFGRSGERTGDFELLDMRERTDSKGRRGFDPSTVSFLAMALLPSFLKGHDNLKAFPDLYGFLIRDIPDIESDNGIAEFDRRFAEFMKVRGFVQRLVEDLEWQRQNPVARVDFSIRTPHLLLETSDGILKLKADWYVEAFFGVDLSLLRVCPAKVRRVQNEFGVEKLRCGKIFLQTRKDQMGCTKKPCSNSLAGKKYRLKRANVEKAKLEREQYGWGNEKKRKK